MFEEFSLFCCLVSFFTQECDSHIATDYTAIYWVLLIDNLPNYSS